MTTGPLARSRARAPSVASAPSANPLTLTGRVAAAALTSWIVPERWWDPVTHAIGGMTVRRRPARAIELGQICGEDRAERALAIEQERIATGHAARLYGLRLYAFPQRLPGTLLRGREHLHRALSQGHGAILWHGDFTFASLISKIALWRDGFRVSHLSRPTHGFASGGFAVRWLNPIWTRIERRYLRERLVIYPEASTTALRALRQRLDQNQVVSIALSDEGSHTITVRLLCGYLTVATGAVSLAMACGAPLLPIFTFSPRPRAFEVEIQPPLNVPADGSNMTPVVEQFAERLAPLVREYPGQWLGLTATA